MIILETPSYDEKGHMIGGVVFMSEKLAEVYEQYDMEIMSTRKGRGATILTTTDGLRILQRWRRKLLKMRIILECRITAGKDTEESNKKLVKVDRM